MQFLVPTVSLSGDACPLWAWQDFRSLGEEDHTPKLQKLSRTTLLKAGKQLHYYIQVMTPGHRKVS